MAIPFKSLNAATATGSGDTLDLCGVAKDFTFAVTATGSPSSVVCRLNGSLDGTQFFNIGLADAGELTITSGGSHYVRYVRVQLSTLTGGTSPTVTAWVTPGEVQEGR